MVIPEYYPPPRVEAWLTLPEGAIVERDDPDWEPPQIGSYVRYPQLRPYKRFVDRFGHEAAMRWGLDWETLPEVLKRVWTSEKLQEQFYGAHPFLSALGKAA